MYNSTSLNCRTSTWTSRTWMNSKIGPKFDHSCDALITGKGNRMLFSTGGWNNEVYSETEVFDTIVQTWSIVQQSRGHSQTSY